MKKLFSVIMAIVVVGWMFVPVTTGAQEEDLTIQEIFNETFENYSQGTWFDNTTMDVVDHLESTGEGTLYKVKTEATGLQTDGLWTISKQAGVKGILSVVDDPTSSGAGKVLRYSNWGKGSNPMTSSSQDAGTSGSTFLTLRRNAVAGGESAVDTAGKTIIVESKVYVASSRIGTDTEVSGYGCSSDFADITNASAYPLMADWGALIGSGPYNARYLPQEFQAASTKTHTRLRNQWETYTLVIDRTRSTAGETGSAAAPDTFRVYRNGELLDTYYRYCPAEKNEDGSYSYSSTTDTNGEISYDMTRKQYVENAIGETGIQAANGSTVQGNELWSMGDFFGMMFGTRGGIEMYIDDLKAYTIDADFSVASVTPPSGSFQPDIDTITATFTSPITETGVQRLCLKDSEGNIVPGAIKNAVLSNENKTVTFTIDGEKVSGQNTYTLIAPAAFSNAYGQGLVTWYGTEKSKLYPGVPEVPDVTLAVLEMEGVQNATTIFTENFDTYTQGALTENATAGPGGRPSASYFDVDTNKTGGVDKDVWFFTNSVAPADLNANTYLDVVDAAEELGVNFENRGNILKYANAEANGKYFLLRLSADNAQDNMLRGKTAIISFDTYIPENYNGGTLTFPVPLNETWNFYSMNQSDVSVTLQNGQLVVSGGQYNNRLLDQKYEAYATGSHVLQTGEWNTIQIVIDLVEEASATNPDTFRVYANGQLIAGNYYYGVNGEAVKDEVPIYDFLPKTYVSNESGISGYDLKVTKSSQPVDEFAGLLLGGVSNGSAATPVYFDNISVKTMDTPFALEQEALSAQFDPAENLTLHFTTPVAQNSLEYIKLLDENGMDITNTAIQDCTLEENGYTLVITLDSAKIIRGEEYRLVFPGNFVDVFGQGMITYYSGRRHASGMPVESTSVPALPDVTVSLVAEKSDEIYVDSLTEENTNYENGTFTASVCFHNVCEDTKPVWCAAAAYTEDNQMIKMVMLDAFTLAGGTDSETKTIVITDLEETEAAEIRLFVWSGVDSMNPYQLPETIQIVE